LRETIQLHRADVRFSVPEEAGYGAVVLLPRRFYHHHHHNITTIITTVSSATKTAAIM